MCVLSRLTPRVRSATALGMVSKSQPVLRAASGLPQPSQTLRQEPGGRPAAIDRLNRSPSPPPLLRPGRIEGVVATDALVLSAPKPAEPPFVARAPDAYVFLEDRALPPVPTDLWGSVILDKPWVTYDLETTGLLKSAPRILEMGCVLTRTDGSRRSFTSLVKPDVDFTGSSSIAIHRLTPDHVAQAPRLPEVTQCLSAFLQREAPDGYVLGGFNTLGFDNLVMREEVARQYAVCPFGRVPQLDMQLAFRTEAPPQNRFDARSLKAAVATFCGREQALAHGAKSDALDASDVLFGFAARYGSPDMRLTDWVKRYEPAAKPSRFRIVPFDPTDAWWEAA